FLRRSGAALSSPESLRWVPGPSAQPLLVSPQALLPACPAVGCLGCRQQYHYRTAAPSALSFLALNGGACRAPGSAENCLAIRRLLPTSLWGPSFRIHAGFHVSRLKLHGRG